MATLDSAEIAGQTTVAPVGSVATRSIQDGAVTPEKLSQEVRDAIDGGGLISKDEQTTDDTPTSVDLLSSDYGLGAFGLRLVVTASRPDGEQGAVWTVDAAVEIGEEGSALIGSPLVTPYLDGGGPSAAFGVAAVAEEGKFRLVLTGDDGVDVDWRVAGFATGGGVETGGGPK